jgi:uncharacterized protein (DUF983 family)
MYGGILFCVFTQWWFASAGLSQEAPAEQPAAFNPPLYKPGNKRCPSCGSPVRRESIGYLWSTRYCTQCGAALRHDIGRAIVGLVLIAPLLAAYLWSIFDETVFPWWGTVLFLLGYLLLIIFNQWWFVSVKLREKAPLKPRSS